MRIWGCGASDVCSVEQVRQRSGAPAVQKLLVPEVLDHLWMHNGASEGAAGLHGSQQAHLLHKLQRHAVIVTQPRARVRRVHGCTRQPLVSERDAVKRGCYAPIEDKSIDSATLLSSSSGCEMALAKRIALTTLSHSLNLACASLSVGLSLTTWQATRQPREGGAARLGRT